jgi:hypothetical protein
MSLTGLPELLLTISGIIFVLGGLRALLGRR